MKANNPTELMIQLIEFIYSKKGKNPKDQDTFINYWDTKRCNKSNKRAFRRTGLLFTG